MGSNITTVSANTNLMGSVETLELQFIPGVAGGIVAGWDPRGASSDSGWVGMR